MNHGLTPKAINLQEAWAKWKRRVRIDLVHQLPLRGTPKVLLRALCDCLNLNRWCWPSNDWLAKAVGKCERTVQYALKQLERLNLIEIAERFDRSGRQRQNHYRIIWQTIGAFTTDSTAEQSAPPRSA